METQKALEIVSYKLGLKIGTEALNDPVLLKGVVEQAIKDKENAEPKSIGLRDYMEATKVVNTLRLEAERGAGDAWVEKMGAEPGVETTASGLRYKLIEEGTGQQCWGGATVKVHYEGKLMDGSVFDSSYERGQPATFPQNAVIAGWQEGLKLMKVGSTYHFYIPQDLGYGERGAGSDIPPYAPLFFEVELLAAF